jgi:hypothetical protein
MFRCIVIVNTGNTGKNVKKSRKQVVAKIREINESGQQPTQFRNAKAFAQEKTMKPIPYRYIPSVRVKVTLN